MKQLKVGTRLALGFALVLLMLAAVIALGINQLASLDAGTRSMAREAYPKVVLAQNLADRINRTARTVRDLLLLSEPEADKKNFAALATSRKESDEMFAPRSWWFSLMPLSTTPTVIPRPVAPVCQAAMAPVLAAP